MANGPIWINEYYGDAIFRTAQVVSTISRKLVDKMQLTIETVMMNGEDFSIVRPKITIGTSRYEIDDHPMFLQEDYFQSPNSCPAPFIVVPLGESNSSFPDVYLGINFMEEMNMTLRVGCDVLATSYLFGSVASGSMRKFERLYMPGTDYGTVADDRVILLFDMDCFEVQVHEQPHQKGKPRVVVNSSKRIVAVSYEAKMLGINRNDTPYLAQALRIYPQLIVIDIPIRNHTTRGLPRPDTSIAREATAKIVKAIKSKLNVHLAVFEFSSNDEFYVDLTKFINSFGNTIMKKIGKFCSNTYLYSDSVSGTPAQNYVFQRLNNLRGKRNLTALEMQEVRLMFGSTIGNIIVEEVLRSTGYQSSVGIGSNKLISKVASGLHKPGSITIIAPSGFENISNIVEAKNVPGLGGKTGEVIKQLFRNCQPTMMNIRSLSAEQLANCSIDKHRSIGNEKANAILLSVNGICKKQVVPATCYQTSGVSRQCSGMHFAKGEIKEIILELSNEFLEKMEYEFRVNQRTPINVNMKIKLIGEGNSPNFKSTLNLQPYEIMTVSPQSLFERFNNNCNTSLNDWKKASSVDSIQITATF